MRVLIAPDDFAGTLSAVEAAEAIAAGWRSCAPHDLLTLMPLSDGGPGFVAALAAATGGDIVPVAVRGPMGETAIGMVVIVGDTAYVESAHGCGLALVPADRRDARAATSFGVGQLVAAALDAGGAGTLRRIVVGLGGTASTDAGAGLLAALGATAVDAQGRAVALDEGGARLATVTSVDLAPALARVGSIALIAATDVDSPLLGPQGASRGFGPQKGADDAAVEELESALTTFARAVSQSADGAVRRDGTAAPDGLKAEDQPGAGAGGGLGFALVLLGASRVPGIDTVMEAVDLTGAISRSDLVITGEGSFDWQSLRGKAVSGVAAAALAQARPVVVIAGRVEVGRREYVALGITEAHSVSEGEEAPGMGREAARALAAKAARIAAQWSR